MKKIALYLSLVMLPAFAASDLTKKLDDLSIPKDHVTPILSKAQLESVNSRYSSLRNRHELTLLGSNNFNADSHIDTKQAGATYRYHINSSWSLGFRYTEYENTLSAAGEKLVDSQDILPDTDYAVKSTDLFINFNTVYGKLRLTDKTVVYFDHYLALGYGDIALASGETQIYTIDTGLSFWFGKHFSSRVGVKNELYVQQKINGNDNTHNVMGYLEFGYLFGEGNRI